MNSSILRYQSSVETRGRRDRHALSVAVDASAIRDKMRLNIIPSIIITSKGGPTTLQTSIVRKHNPGAMTILTPSLFLVSLTAFASTTLSLALAVPPTSDLSPIHHPANLTSTPTPDTEPVPSSSSSTSSSLSANSLAHCQTSKTPFTRSRPRFTDCGAAIRKLPSNPTIGTFHTAGADTVFRLPVVETSGSCTVDVRMMTGTGAEDVSTWLAIRAAATQLNMACVHGFAFPLKMGGWTAVGRDGRIGVVLRYSGTRGIAL